VEADGVLIGFLLLLGSLWFGFFEGGVMGVRPSFGDVVSTDYVCFGLTVDVFLLPSSFSFPRDTLRSICWSLEIKPSPWLQHRRTVRSDGSFR
jgi:hypothetical protein